MSFDRLRHKWSHIPPPIIVFNKSHSGSRVLARLLLQSGVFMGHDRNESEDAADILRLVRPLVEDYYPHYSEILRSDNTHIEALIDSVLEYHLKEYRLGDRWGWKLCETVYILPILKRIFPDACFVHLIRDGRDVAFSDHVAPVEPFWRKIYFDTDKIDVWNHIQLKYRTYERYSHIFNARHWVNSVTLARHYGSMIGETYFKLRYEDLVQAPEATAARLLSDIGITPNSEIIQAFAKQINTSAVGKYRMQPRAKLRQVMDILEPALTAEGYEGTTQKRPKFSLRSLLFSGQ
jgi:Sulfotransferase family